MAKIKRIIVIFLTTLLFFTPVFPAFTIPVKVNSVYASLPREALAKWGPPIHFLYDGDGVRVAKIEEGKTTLYVGDLEKNLTTGEVTKYYSLGGKRVAVKEGNSLSYIVSDHLGSLRSLGDLSGAKKGDLSYYPYGQIRTKTGTLPSRQYTSQINDSSTGLYFYNARYYNPRTANFLTADSVGTIPNKYAYAGRNPLTFNDPSGNDDENTTNPQDNCTSNPFSSSCITLGPIDTYTPIQATQPLTAQPCYSQEECKANQEAFIGELMLLGFVFGGGMLAEALVGPVSASTATEFVVTGAASSPLIQQITQPANSLIDRLARLPISLRQTVTDTFRTKLKTGGWVNETYTVNLRQRVFEQTEGLSPIAGAKEIMHQAGLENKGGIFLRHLLPHNAYRSVINCQASCLDATVVAQDFLGTQGITSQIVNLSRSIPHYGLYVPSVETLIFYGGKSLSGGPERIARVLERLSSITGGATGLLR